MHLKAKWEIIAIPVNTAIVAIQIQPSLSLSCRFFMHLYLYFVLKTLHINAVNDHLFLTNYVILWLSHHLYLSSVLNLNIDTFWLYMDWLIGVLKEVQERMVTCHKWPLSWKFWWGSFNISWIILFCEQLDISSLYLCSPCLKFHLK